MNFNFNTDKNRESESKSITFSEVFSIVAFIYVMSVFILGDWNIFNASIFARTMMVVCAFIFIGILSDTVKTTKK